MKALTQIEIDAIKRATTAYLVKFPKHRSANHMRLNAGGKSWLECATAADREILNAIGGDDCDEDDAGALCDEMISVSIACL